MTAAVSEPGRLVAARAWERSARLLAVGAVFALAAALRLTSLAATPVDPFYDAAVRSMGTSWHAFLVGAFEPSAGLAIDKPPVDLWLQVASARVFGFGHFALLLPAALGGTLAVVALYDLLRTVAGARAALLGSLALAVLPIAVVTARSDTMDSVMAALLVAAFAVSARGLRRGGVWSAVIAGALLGLAFEVKLFEALIAAPPLVLLWWLGSPRPARRVASLGGAAVIVGLAWLAVVTLAVPSAQRPWAFGSSHGSAWDAAFVYDGWSRLTGASAPGVSHGSPSTPGASRVPGPPGPLRLASSRVHLGGRIGIELLAAWLALALAAVTGGWRGLDRVSRAALAALSAWLALGTVLFSLQSAMRPRYLEAFDPAIAACFGIGVALAANAMIAAVRRPAAVRCAAVVIAGAVLAPSLVASVDAVRTHAQDSGGVGAIPAARDARLTAYLRAQQGSARYEVASLSASPAAPVIVHDGRPVLVLTAAGRTVVSVKRLARLVDTGQVRTAIASGHCTLFGCTRLQRWIRTHGTDVSRLAAVREPHARTLYRFDRPGAAGVARA